MQKDHISFTWLTEVRSSRERRICQKALLVSIQRMSYEAQMDSSGADASRGVRFLSRLPGVMQAESGHADRPRMFWGSSNTGRWSTQMTFLASTSLFPHLQEKDPKEAGTRGCCSISQQPEGPPPPRQGERKGEYWLMCLLTPRWAGLQPWCLVSSSPSLVRGPLSPPSSAPHSAVP